MASFRTFNFTKDGYIADIASSTTIYHGFYNADPQTVKLSSGSLDTASAQFMIAKETRNGSGDTTNMQWASTAGNPLTYNQVWDNRVSLTYI